MSIQIPEDLVPAQVGGKVTDAEYEDVISYALTIGVNNAFIQEGDAAQESFIPNFDKNII